MPPVPNNFSNRQTVTKPVFRRTGFISDQTKTKEYNTTCSCYTNSHATHVMTLTKSRRLTRIYARGIGDALSAHRLPNIPPPSNHKITQGSREITDTNDLEPATHIHTTSQSSPRSPLLPPPPRLKDAGAGHQTRTGMILAQPMGRSDPTLTCSTVPSPHLHAPTTLRATRKETLDARKHMAP